MLNLKKTWIDAMQICSEIRSFRAGDGTQSCPPWRTRARCDLPKINQQSLAWHLAIVVMAFFLFLRWDWRKRWEVKARLMKLKTVLSYHPLVVSLIEDLSLNHRAEPSTATEFSEFLSSREFDWKTKLWTRALPSCRSAKTSPRLNAQKPRKNWKDFGLKFTR